MARRKKLPTFRRQNISNEMLQKWQSLKRKNDAKAIRGYIEKGNIPETGSTVIPVFSIATINNALAYGYVHTYELQHAITWFYWERMQQEKKAIEKLTDTAVEESAPVSDPY